MAGFVLANRILGFVNAPALMQRVVAKVTEVCVDIAPYARRRDLLAQILSEAGYRFLLPKGAFYFFPEAPGGDDLAFVDRLKQENVLAVPGRGFGREGYFRLAFCVPETVIAGAAAGFARAAQGLRDKMILGEGQGAVVPPSPKPPPNPLRVLPEPGSIHRLYNTNT